VRIPAKSPNCNPHAERVVKTFRSECLDHFVIFGERHLRHLLREFVAHDHGERFHQALDGQLISPPASESDDSANAAVSRGTARQQLLDRPVAVTPAKEPAWVDSWMVRCSSPDWWDDSMAVRMAGNG
jgi:hypothetical protein